RSGLAEDYVSSIVEKKPIVYYPITIGRTFLAHTPAPVDFNTQIYAEQHNIIKELASKSDCVIIGRCADYILRELEPFKMFVYADMPSRVARCRTKAPKDEKPLTDKQLARHISGVDAERADYYKFFTGQKWLDAEHYDLMINTSHMVIKDFVPALAMLIQNKK
ncbi:MAG: cytidylate kinase-like family protein, partial [Clostridia bacterium]|nr:cytidylate kinase-like family protein [Clostridia bacterium]